MTTGGRLDGHGNPARKRAIPAPSESADTDGIVDLYGQSGATLDWPDEGISVDWRLALYAQSRIMPTVRYVREIRLSTGAEYRIIYVIETASGPVVLHAFQKKSRQTSRRDMELARQRFREM